MARQHSDGTPDPWENTLRPSAREVFAVRLTHEETRTDKHGREHTLVVTDPWPEDFDLESHLYARGLRR